MEEDIKEEGYKEALDYLFSYLPMFSRTGAPAYKPGLETSISLAEKYDNPHKKFKSIHVGGTNGKGSTSHMLTSVLQAQGYKVGLYTSPHLVDFRERMRINGKMIPKEKVVEFVDSWKETASDSHPSFFELTMMMAFQWFAEEKVDYAVIEVGMGGRLDSTNIITPVLSVITNISYDHNQFLGETLEQIAGEKAGIIKPGIPVVIGERQIETEKVFREKALKEKSSIVFADEVDIDVRKKKGGQYLISGPSMPEEINLPLQGDYQEKNLATVLGGLSLLRSLGVEIDKTSVKNGLENVIANTGLAGRWMIIERTPLTIADTGHNIAGLTFNFSQLSGLVKGKEGRKLRVVIGFVADKAIDKILEILPKDAEYYITNAKIPRALPAEKLEEKFFEKGLSGKRYDNVAQAFEAAKNEAAQEDIIFIGGSTFIVADFLETFNQGSFSSLRRSL